MNIILNTTKSNLKNKEIVCLSLKILNFIAIKEFDIKQTEPNFDISIMVEIINDIMSIFDDHLDIIIQLCELTKNLFKISNEVWLKKFLLDIIVNNASNYLTKQVKIIILILTITLT